MMGIDGIIIIRCLGSFRIRANKIKFRRAFIVEELGKLAWKVNHRKESSFEST